MNTCAQKIVVLALILSLIFPHQRAYGGVPGLATAKWCLVDVGKLVVSPVVSPIKLHLTKPEPFDTLAYRNHKEQLANGRIALPETREEKLAYLQDIITKLGGSDIVDQLLNSGANSDLHHLEAVISHLDFKKGVSPELMEKVLFMINGIRAGNATSLLRFLLRSKEDRAENLEWTLFDKRPSKKEIAEELTRRGISRPPTKRERAGSFFRKEDRAVEWLFVALDIPWYASGNMIPIYIPSVRKWRRTLKPSLVERFTEDARYLYHIAMAIFIAFMVVTEAHDAGKEWANEYFFKELKPNTDKDHSAKQMTDEWTRQLEKDFGKDDEVTNALKELYEQARIDIEAKYQAESDELKSQKEEILENLQEERANN